MHTSVAISALNVAMLHVSKCPCCRGIGCITTRVPWRLAVAASEAELVAAVRAEAAEEAEARQQRAVAEAVTEAAAAVRAEAAEAAQQAAEEAEARLQGAVAEAVTEAAVAAATAAVEAEERQERAVATAVALPIFGQIPAAQRECLVRCHCQASEGPVLSRRFFVLATLSFFS